MEVMFVDNIYNKICAIATECNGFVKTSQIEEAKISRSIIKKYVDKGLLEEIRKGLYVTVDIDIDEFALLQVQCSSLIFSYGTALYFWGLTDIIPSVFDITVPQGENISRLHRDNRDIKVHYVLKNLYSIGITETHSPQGGVIKLYDKERCLCDLIKDRNKIEKQLYIQAIKEYFKCRPNTRKLLKYGKVFGIEEEIRAYSEVLL